HAQPPKSPSFGSAATRSAPSGGRIATGAYYTLVHIRRHPARLGEIMEVRPDEGAIVRRVRRGASDVAGAGTDTGAGRPDVTGHVVAPRLVCARRTGGSAMRTLMESLKLLLAKIRKLVTGQR